MTWRQPKTNPFVAHALSILGVVDWPIQTYVQLVVPKNPKNRRLTNLISAFNLRGLSPGFGGRFDRTSSVTSIKTALQEGPNPEKREYPKRHRKPNFVPGRYDFSKKDRVTKAKNGRLFGDKGNLLPLRVAALTRVDFLGSAIFIPSIIFILLGLVLGGTSFPWSSYHTIVPLVLGFLGWALFDLHQASRFCKEPSVPPRLFLNRTSASGFIPTFLSSMLLQTVANFMPVYYQAVKGVGLLALLSASSSKAAWVCYQMVAAAGTGILLSSVLPAILSALHKSNVAKATGAYSFVRSFGYVRGVTIPSIVFNSQFDKNAYRIGDASVRVALANGVAYGFASGGFIPGLEPTIGAKVVSVYADALMTVWYLGAAWTAVGFFCVFVEKLVELRKELHTEYGLDAGTAHDGERKMMVAKEEEEGRPSGLASREGIASEDDPVTDVASAAVLGENIVPVGMA
ncbi:hypothetical protein MMC25_000960 [Agyrium rufum]|nr:hypothetical protein [Agyrium rufum]